MLFRSAAVVAEQGVLFGDPPAEAPAPAPAYSGAPASVEGGGFTAEPQGEAPAPSAPASHAAPVYPPSDGGGYRVSDYEGRVYDGLSSEAASAMPVPPVPSASDARVTADVDLDNVRRELESISDEAAQRYQQRMDEWKSAFNIPEPTMPGPRGGDSGGGASPSMFGGIDLGKAPADDVEEISGMPTEDSEDNSQSFRRSRRRRISGFFDTEDDEDDEKGGE